MMKITPLIVTVCNIGRLPVAPGTFGSLVGLMAGGTLILTCPGFYLGIAIGSTFCTGLFFIPRYLQAHPHKKDPSEIVIDEVLGQMIALAACENILEMVLAFILFRIFDIWKPWPVSWADQLKGGLTKNTISILLDDILAGILALFATGYIRSFY